MLKKIILGILIISTLIFSNALDFLPQNYEFVFYTPDIEKLYNAFKSTNAGDVLANQLGLESMIISMIQQQLMAQNYSLDDIDIFKELLIAGNKDNIVFVIGPSKNPDKIKEIYENFTGNSYPEEINVINGYFVFGNNYGGGTPPANFTDYLSKGYLGVTYVNIESDPYKFNGSGYITSNAAEKTLIFHQEITPLNDESASLVEEINASKGKNIIADPNVGGDFLIFINRKLPEFLYSLIDSVSIATKDELNIKSIEEFDGTAYLSADFSQIIINSLSNEFEGPYDVYGVMYYQNPSWDLLSDEISDFVTINGEKYGIIATEQGTPIAYIRMDNEKIVFYGKNPGEYITPDKTFLSENYDPKYITGLFWNLSPTIFNLLGVETDSYIKFTTYIEDKKIVQHSVMK
ncbi:hypothetical protein JYK00_03450 [Thermosipho ferrireducens]|uniref:Uncharacterized protein n=1 Tax=Thermosipho ferrireducens TaxID=2571116 RepID=A0ABX7SB48_9BACT|nr:hypothetical protein [Thermosipho ferrireducens]QTA38580.1 hypothetical protein JYK00_03450 [Thermosipho ferrireducens]